MFEYEFGMPELQKMPGRLEGGLREIVGSDLSDSLDYRKDHGPSIKKMLSPLARVQLLMYMGLPWLYLKSRDDNSPYFRKGDDSSRSWHCDGSRVKLASSAEDSTALASLKPRIEADSPLVGT